MLLKKIPFPNNYENVQPGKKPKILLKQFDMWSLLLSPFSPSSLPCILILV